MVLAYGMLVFDQRYALPLTPVLIGFAIRFALPPGQTKDLPSCDLNYSGRWQAAVAALLILGLIAVQVYWASPFRTMNQDFQSSVYEAASVLTSNHAHNIVAIGDGPYPEHGVGWEAGVYAAYFGGSRIVAGLFEVPREVNVESVVSDVQKLRPDAVMIWGASCDSIYRMLVSRIQQTYPQDVSTVIRDPRKGEVGTVVILK
jgi:hypothetical protein